MSDRDELQVDSNKEGEDTDPSELVAEIPDDIQEQLDELGLGNEKSEKLIAVIEQVSRSYKGPLPTAEQFAMYEQACSGAGDRILGYMEREQEARHRFDGIAINASVVSMKWGQGLAAVIMFSLIVLAGFAIYLGSSFIGGIIAFLVAGVGVCHKFIDGKCKPDKNKKA